MARGSRGDEVRTPAGDAAETRLNCRYDWCDGEGEPGELCSGCGGYLRGGEDAPTPDPLVTDFAWTETDRCNIERLLAGGYVVIAESGGGYQLTDSGRELVARLESHGETPESLKN